MDARKRRILFLCLVILVAVLAGAFLAAVVLCNRGVLEATGAEPIPAGMEPFVTVRAATRTRSLKDLDHIKLQVWWQNEPIIVPADSPAASLMLRGLQEALETKRKFGNCGGAVTLYWLDGTRSGPFGFAPDGWRFCFSPWFILGVNQVVPREYRLPLSEVSVTPADCSTRRAIAQPTSPTGPAPVSR